MEFIKESESVAIIDGGRSYSYKELIERINFFKDVIKVKSIEKTTIIIHGTASFDRIALLLALSTSKCCIVPVVPTTKEELNTKIRISNAEWIITESLQFQRIERRNCSIDLIEPILNKGNSALIIFSSGSTGEPKAILHDFSNLLANYQSNKRRNLIFAVLLLFDHIGGINSILNVLGQNATMVLPGTKSPKGLAEAISKYQINVLPASPTYLNLMMLEGAFQEYSMKSLRLVTYGTEPMSHELLLRLNKALPRVKFLQTFGTSETGIISTKSVSSDSLLIRFDDPKQQVKVVNEELWIKSDLRAIGYINSDEDRFDKDGWFKTGDMVKEIEKGIYQIIGRKSKIINVGGLKVFPAEVENIISQLEWIDDCTVYGVSSPITGQVVHARVVTRRNESKSTLRKEIKSHCIKLIESFKVPVKILFEEKINYSARFKKRI